MKREISQLSDRVYDLLVIGGGIYGACIAWEAILRGLSVALVDRGDFGNATSANSLKIIHGGLRYLQNADLKRMRQSIQERTTLMRIAPHLIHPLPVMIPTTGWRLKSRSVLSMALWLNDLISCDRNQLTDPQKHIPRGKIIGKQTVEQLLPGFASQKLTGAAIFHDAQVYNSERLTLAFVRSAAEQGAAVANYVEVKNLLRSGNRIIGARVEDRLTQEQFEIQSKTVVNATGGWVNQILAMGKTETPEIPLAKAMNLVLRRSLFADYAVGIDSRYQASDDKQGLEKGGRLLFVAPWRGKSIVGTYYSICDRHPSSWQIGDREVDCFLNQINQAYPLAQVTREDIAWIHQGVLPRTGIDSSGEPILAKHYQISDSNSSGLTGLISVVGVKYTTARNVAQKTVDIVFKSWGKTPSTSISAITPLYGGQIENFSDFLERSIATATVGLTTEVIHRLVYNYGSAYPEVLQYLDPSQELNEQAVIKAEVIYGIRQEMAQKLSDVVFRRTELGTAGHPGNEVLTCCAETMRTELGWGFAKTQQELQEVKDVYENQSLVVA